MFCAVQPYIPVCTGKRREIRTVWISSICSGERLKKTTGDLKKVYGAPSLKAAKTAFETFQTTWKSYPGAVDIWTRNFQHVEQLFDYGNAVRKIMYTTNAIEAVNSSFRKVTKKGSFPNDNAVYKLLYLRITELQKKWDVGHNQNWSMVLNQLLVNEKFADRIKKYLTY